VERAPVRFARTADGVRIAYSALGEGPSLVVVRGWITHLELQWEEPTYRSFFERLVRHLRVVRFDARGNGLSDRRVGEYSLDTLTLDAEAVMDALGLNDVVLWGSSFGGPVAVNYAAKHRDRVGKLLLDGTFASYRRIIGDERREAFVAMLEGMKLQPEGLFAYFSFLTDPEPSSSHVLRVERLRRSINADAAIKLYGLLHDIDVTEQARSLDLPSLVLHRRQTHAIPFELGRELASLIPGASFVALQGTAHNPWEERPAEALMAIATFLGLEKQFRAESSREPAPLYRTAVILMTDVAESTRLTEELGDSAYRRHAKAIDEGVRRCVAAVGGWAVEGRTLGDGLLAVFPSARQAIDAATECVAQSSPGGLTLRIGIHAGDVIEEAGNVHGGAVNVAARICELAAPGRVLVSDAVRMLARTSTDAKFVGRGGPVLRGVGERHALFEVMVEPRRPTA